MWIGLVQRDILVVGTSLHGPKGVEMFADESRPGELLLIAEYEIEAWDGPPLAPTSLVFAGGSYGSHGGPYLFRVGVWTPQSARAEFLSWYQEEHLPMLLACPEWDGCRFVEAPVDEGCQFYALHQLTSRAALDSEERRQSRATPWFQRLKAHSWFDEAFTRDLYMRIEGSKWS